MSAIVEEGGAPANVIIGKNWYRDDKVNEDLIALLFKKLIYIITLHALNFVYIFTLSTNTKLGNGQKAITNKVSIKGLETKDTMTFS